MKECSKSITRRQTDPNFINRYFVGEGIDIGGAPDPLSLYRELFPRMGEVRIWDLADGDAQAMAGVDDESYDFVHSSHCLEHLNDPQEGIENWFRIVKPGGHLIVTAPDEDLYEQGVFPSTFNSDHKWTFTIFKQGSWSAHSRNLLAMLSRLGPAADVQKIELLTASFRYALPRFDQTLTPIAEAGIEFVVRKRPEDEVRFGGRRPPEGAVDRTQFTLLTGIRLRPEPAAEEQVKKRLEAAMVDHRAGRLDEAETQYRRLLDTNEDYPDALHLLGLCHHQRGDNPQAQPFIERAIAVKPGAPEFHNSLGLVMRGMQKHETAVEALGRALQLEPNYLNARKNLALTFTDMKDYEKAGTVLRSAIEIWPEEADLRSMHGRVLLLTDQLKPAVAELERALQLAPDHVGALNNLGVALEILGRHEDAKSTLERALAIDPEHVDANLNYGHQLLRAGQFEAGWKHYDWRLARFGCTLPRSAPRWRGEPLDGRTIMLRCEQGFGDAFHFVRYAPMVAARGGRVIVECRKPLLRLLSSVEGVAEAAEPRRSEGYDLYCPMMSLAGVFQTRSDTMPNEVPYIPVPEPAALDAVDGVKRVGLVWAGNPDHLRDHHRTRPLTDFAPLAGVPNVAFFGLQLGDAAAEPRPPGMRVADAIADVEDFLDTARVLAALDLVIAVDTSVAHLAGAMGMPVWLLIDKVGDWRWLEEREDTPWYPTMRLFRRQDGWDEVFQRVAAALAEY